MKIVVSLILLNALIAVYAIPSKSSRDRVEQTLKTRLLSALCALKGKSSDVCLHDVRMQKAMEKLIDTALEEGKLREAATTGETSTSKLLGHLISQKQRRQSSFYSNW